MKTKKTEIPKYSLDKFRPVHRQEKVASSFGYNQIEPSKIIEGFELYSSVGLISSIGPLKSEFYRMSVTVIGSLDMQIGLEQYQHHPRTLAFTFPNQIFQKNNISKKTFGYYILFNANFLNDFVPSIKIAEEFPFFDIAGMPVFQLNKKELDTVVALIFKMNDELQQAKTGTKKAIKMYLYLSLLEAKRSYERQQFHVASKSSNDLVARFRKLVSMNYRDKRQVADYAELLAVSPNHLNRVIKEKTAQTASDTIKEMLVQEAKSLLRYTTNSISEIAYQLDFNDPATFNRFFKKATGETPMAYRNKHN